MSSAAPKRRRKAAATTAAGAVQGWNFACPDWAARLKQGRIPAALEGRAYNEPRAARVLQIFCNLRLPDVAGQPLLQDACGDWFKRIVAAIAGSLGSDGVANVRDVLIEVAKKNSKSSNAGLLMLALMLASPRPRAEFLILAPTLAIAEISFRQIAGAIYADAELQQLLHVREHLRTIEHRASGCRLMLKTFSIEIATGVKPAAVLLDEAWLLQSEHAPRVIGQLRGGMASLPEALMITISTAADAAPVGYWRTELDKARAVRDGSLQLDGYLPILYELPPEIANSEQEWQNSEHWPLVNPNIGRSVTLQWLQAAFTGAKAAGRTELLRWASQHLNLEINGSMAASDNKWAGSRTWSKQQHQHVRTLDQLITRSDLIMAGVDGGGADDLFAVAVVGRDADTGAWLAWAHCWAYPGVLELRKSISGLLRDFESAGELTIAPPGTDMAELCELIKRLEDTGLLHKVGIDPAGIGQEIGTALEAYGVPADKVLGVKQGFGLLPAWTTMERRLAEGRMFHCGQKLLAWCVANCQRSERGLVTKAAAGTAKIDAAVAMANAAALLLEAPEPFNVEAFITGAAPVFR